VAPFPGFGDLLATWKLRQRQSQSLLQEELEEVIGMKREGQRQTEVEPRLVAGVEKRPKDPSRGRVLVVDDETAICDLLSLYLGWKGLEVKTANSPAVALARAYDTEFDVVILDWDLAGVEALDLLNFFKGTWPQISVIIYTGQAIDEAFLKTTLSGRADAILRKLGSLDSFWHEVSRQLAKRNGQARGPSRIGEIQ
jgi:CheY-like chemotaxis protein